MNRQEEFVLRTLEERDIRFVRLWFTDVLGFLKSVAVAPAELEGAFAEGIGFDGSAIEGFARVYESDMLAKPDPSTFQVLPWRAEAPGTARMFCDILMPDGSPSLRRPALRAQARAGQGLRPGLHLLHPPRDRVLPAQGASRAPASAPDPVDDGRLLRPHPARRRPRLPPRRRSRCSSRWASRSSSATTRARPGQQEIDLRYADALTTADNIMTFRLVMKEVALEQGVYATFMPKPFTEHPGSGMHTHLSLFEGDRNAFYEAGARVPAVQGRPLVHRRPAAARRRDHRGHQPVGQLLQAAAAGGGEAPSYVCWGHNNRSALVRVPMYKPRQGPARPASSSARSTAPATPTWPSRCCSPPGLKGIEEGYELPPAPRTTSGR